MSKRILLLVLVPAFLLSACGSDSDGDDSASTTTVAESDAQGSAASSTGATAGGKSHEDASKAELEVWQKDLDAIGCWAGPVDGTLGPQTEAAIKAFQAAEGLTVDGLLGPKTKAALTEAAAAGKTVCTDTTSGTTTTKPASGGSGSGGSASLSAADYSNTFTLGSCTSSDETSIKLQGQVNNLSLVASAAGGSGSLSVSGGTEEDGITLNGSITSVTVGDTGEFTVKGTFGGSNLAGEAFTLTGSCA